MKLATGGHPSGATVRRRRAAPTTPSACLIGAKFAFTNAERLFEAAQVLEKQRHFGPAVTIYATSAEEGAKALALWIAGASSNTTLSPRVQRLLARVMADHPTKHAVASVASAATSVWFWLVIALVSLLKRDALDGLPEAVIDHPENMATGWFAAAPRLRQAGAYVDFEAGAWMTPDRVTAANAAEARSEVESFLALVARPFARDPGNRPDIGQPVRVAARRPRSPRD